MSKRECEGKDVMHLGPQVRADGSRLCVRHKPDHTWQEGILKPVKEGEPLNSEYSCLALERREDGAFDVNVLMEGTAPAAEGSGPAMVNSEKFKTGWDRIFGKSTVGVA
jgi:hypothetical protein